MPIYDYRCPQCDWEGERIVVCYEATDWQWCDTCEPGPQLERLIGTKAPLGRVQGVIPKGGGPDKFTADMLGIPLKELPPGLKTDARVS